MPPKFPTNKNVVIINNIRVDFPFQPYPQQVRYMKELLSSYQKRQNSLLESPTGTGKSLAILCATLAYIQQLKSNKTPEIPKIIYASRTHTQLSEVINELKKTRFNPKITILGSRKQFCIHERVKRIPPGFKQDSSCRKLSQNHSCQYHSMVDKAKPETFFTQIMNHEDYIAKCSQSLVCPFFLGRKLVETAEIVFLPYNYLFDEATLNTMGLVITNQIIIFDEGHNLPSVLTSQSSFEFNLLELDMSLGALESFRKGLGLVTKFQPKATQIMNKVAPSPNANNKPPVPKVFQKFIKAAPIPITRRQSLIAPSMYGSTVMEQPDYEIINNLEKQNNIRLRNMTTSNLVGLSGSKQQNNTPLSRSNSNNGQNNKPHIIISSHDIHALRIIITQYRNAWSTIPLKHDLSTRLTCATLPGKEIYEVLKKAQITTETVGNILDQLKVMLEEMSEIENSSSLSKFESHLQSVFPKKFGGYSEFTPQQLDHFRLFIYEQETSRSWMKNVTNMSKVRSIGFWCFSPSISMQKFAALRPRSFVLTSGTLSPLTHLAQEYAVPFPIQLENDHVVSSDRVSFGVISAGPRNIKLNGSYYNRNSLDYKIELGLTILNLCKFVPGGILVFFPSYSFMQQMVNAWKQPFRLNGKSIRIYHEIGKCKHVMVEPNNSSQIQAALTEYKEYFATGGSCLFFAVCRGKIAEGLSFKDDYARCCLVVGLPYPSLYDPQVVLHKQYRDLLHSLNKKSMSGSSWYNAQCFDAVNQSIGRVIRHAKDFGSILLVDERYGYPGNQKQINSWLKNKLVKFRSFSHAKTTLEVFFNTFSGTHKTESRKLSLISSESFGSKGEFPTTFSSSSSSNQIEPSSSSKQAFLPTLRKDSSPSFIFGSTPTTNPLSSSSSTTTATKSSQMVSLSSSSPNILNSLSSTASKSRRIILAQKRVDSTPARILPAQAASIRSTRHIELEVPPTKKSHHSPLTPEQKILLRNKQKDLLKSIKTKLASETYKLFVSKMRQLKSLVRESPIPLKKSQGVIRTLLSLIGHFPSIVIHFPILVHPLLRSYCQKIIDSHPQGRLRSSVIFDF